MIHNNKHTYHIPVLGIGYSIDTPLKVAQYGIDSTISLVDDILFEQLRKMYCGKNNLPYTEITEKSVDYRADRITAYLNLIKQLSEKNFEELKNAASSNKHNLDELLKMTPIALQKDFKAFRTHNIESEEIRAWLDHNLSMGSIDVNIMTKVDKDNYRNGEKLPAKYNDAHAALKGYANSDLESTLVLSAGINPRLYSYMAEFEDFYPDKHGKIKKKIALKVSDHKSAMIQGKFLAKKGLWVSEFRIESGLNCGGHAFATEGHLLGPILAEFKDNFQVLKSSIYEVLINGLEAKNIAIPESELPIKFTAQGGVGTAEEHQFLIDHYNVDSVGWGTPFLLVPEATTVDEQTLEKLKAAKEDDLYLSNISPLGVPFNNLRGNTRDLEKLARIAKGKPGSPCSKKYAELSYEFPGKPLCVASRRYQTIKLKELSNAGMSAKAYKKAYDKVVEKSCICAGLGTTSLLVHKLETISVGTGVSICPGPNMAYFNKTMSLREITDHIYGKANFISRTDRPNMFIKELQIYIKFLKNKMNEAGANPDRKQLKYFQNYTKNMLLGIDYYQELIENSNGIPETQKPQLFEYQETLNFILSEIENLKESQQLVSSI